MLKKGFTLAEVLITLAIVGVVAAMTLPTLISKINDKVNANQAAVFKSKLVKGLNLTKTAGDLNSTYESTQDFLENGLSKHFKIAKICGASNIRECIPYDKIKYMKDEKTEEFVETSKINSIRLLGLKSEKGFKDVAGFVTGDGTVVIASYKIDCLQDTEKLDVDINECLAGIYDLNGSRKPNKSGKDILPFNGANINNGILATLGGVKIISNAQVYDGIQTNVYCKDNKPIKEYADAGVTKCCAYCAQYSYGDNWAAAAKACHDMGGRLPNKQELVYMANALYKGMNATVGSGYSYGDDGNGNRTTIGSGSPVPAALSGLGSSWYALWSSDEERTNSDAAYSRGFLASRTLSRLDSRNYNYPWAVCVTD